MTPDNTTAKLELTIGLLESLKEECPLRANIIDSHIEQIKGVIIDETNKYRALVDLANGNSWGNPTVASINSNFICTDLDK